MCQICRSGGSILEVAFSLCGPREMATLQEELKDAGAEPSINEHDTPAFIFGALCNALALHCVQQGLDDPMMMANSVILQWKKLTMMKAAGVKEHEIDKKLREYES